MKTRITEFLLDLLDLVEDFVFLASRPGLNRLNRYWGYTEMRAASRALDRLERQQFLEKTRQGEKIVYRITAKGKELLRQRRPSVKLRNRKWDGRWRMVVFDFPETARKGRDAFRRLLCQQRMGCLQKSVWITPDPIIPAWRKVLTDTSLTDWVLLFESAELGPVDDIDIARKVWHLDELSKRYEQFITKHASLESRLHVARQSDLSGELGQVVRKESREYSSLLADDPLLPSSLLPSGFAAVKADALHANIRVALRHCLLKKGY
jgi:phenylacetic acid degradation operon negative regulatory protein